MGIGRQEARALLANVKAGTTRATRRDEVAAAVDLLNEWLSKRDAQDAEAAGDFAATKAGQFRTLVDALPDPDLAPDLVP